MIPASIMVQSFTKLVDIHDAFTSSQYLKNLPEKQSKSYNCSKFPQTQTLQKKMQDKENV